MRKTWRKPYSSAYFVLIATVLTSIPAVFISLGQAAAIANEQPQDFSEEQIDEGERSPNCDPEYIDALVDNISERLGHYASVDRLVSCRESNATTLTQVLESNAHPNIREYAFSQLSLIGTPEALNAIAAALVSNPYLTTREQAVQSLRSLSIGSEDRAMRDMAITSLINAVTENDYPSIRMQAISALRVEREKKILGSQAAINAISTAIQLDKEPDPEIRAEAIDSLFFREVYVGDQSSTNAIISALQQDDDDAVRFAAIRALNKFGKRTIVSARDVVLEALSSDPYNGVRRLAVTALGSIADSAALEAIIAALESHEGLYVRITAVEELAKFVSSSRASESPVAFEAIVDASASDESWYVRGVSIDALGDIESQESTEAIIAAAQSDEHDSVRSRAVKILGEIRTPEALTVVRSVLQNDDEPSVRSEAISAVLKMTSGQATFDILLAARADESCLVREKALSALISLDVSFPDSYRREDQLSCLDSTVIELPSQDYGRYSTPAVSEDKIETLFLFVETLDEQAAKAELIEQLHQNSDLYVRKEVAERLKSMLAGAEEPEVIDALIRALRSDDSYIVRLEAVESLGAVRNVPAVQSAFFTALRTDRESRIRAAAVQAISLTDEMAVSTFLDVLQSEENTPVKLLLIRALGRLEYPSDRVITVLLAELKEDWNPWNYLNKSEIIQILGRNPSPRTNQALIEVLQSEQSYHTRTSAVQALAQISDPSITDLLIESLQSDRQYEVRRAAVTAISTRPERAAKIALLQALKSDTNPDVRRAIVWALRSIGDEESVRAIVEALGSDNKPEVLYSAALALGELKAEMAVPTLVTVMKNDEEIDLVRTGAVVALAEINSSTSVTALNQNSELAILLLDRAFADSSDSNLADAVDVNPNPNFADDLRDHFAADLAQLKLELVAWASDNRPYICKYNWISNNWGRCS